MAIVERTDQNGHVWLDGVYVQQNHAIFLGLRNLCEKTECLKGFFYVGFDNRIQPATIRIFYEPKIVSPYAHTIGLIQFGEYRFCGEPLTPEKYSPEINYKKHYTNQVFDGPEHFWLDIMDPVSAHDLLRPQQLYPCYAFNNLLAKNRSFEDFYSYGGPNGALLKIHGEHQAKDSLVASLTAPVGLDLDVLDEKAITKEIDKYREKMGEEPIFCSEYDFRFDYIQNVVTQLNLRKRELDKSDTIDIVDGDIRWVKVIGQYIMIQFDDPEYVGGLICVFVSASGCKGEGGKKLVAYNFDTYTFERLVLDANIYMFEQSKAANVERRAFSDFIGGRGRKSSHPSSFFLRDEKEVSISFKHRTFGYALTQQGPEILDGIEWEVSRKFDMADLKWGSLEFSPLKWAFPSPLAPYNLLDFRSMLEPERPPNFDKPSSPSIWFSVPQVISLDRAVGFGERATSLQSHG
jgi:hypothetical protein